MFGNLITDFGSLFEAFFKGTVVNMIRDSVQLTLETGIPVIANKVLNLSDGYLPIPLVEDWAIDWETPEKILVTSTAIEVGVKGLFFDKSQDSEPDVEIPDMPYRLFSKTQSA